MRGWAALVVLASACEAPPAGLVGDPDAAGANVDAAEADPDASTVDAAVPDASVAATDAPALESDGAPVDAAPIDAAVPDAAPPPDAAWPETRYSWTVLLNGEPASCNQAGIQTVTIHEWDGFWDMGTIPCHLHEFRVPMPENFVDESRLYASDASGSIVATGWDQMPLFAHDVDFIIEVFDEPDDTLAAIVAGAVEHWTVHGAFPAAEPTTPQLGACCGSLGDICGADPSDWQTPGWAALGFSIGRHRYQYEFTTGTQGGMASFTARAYGNFDCNASISTYEITGVEDGFGGIALGALTVTNEQEVELEESMPFPPALP